MVGRLPLCLNIAARMICSAGEGWEEEVLAEMRAGSNWRSDNTDDGASLQDSIIVASVKRYMYMHPFSLSLSHIIPLYMKHRGH